MAIDPQYNGEKNHGTDDPRDTIDPDRRRMPKVEYYASRERG
jgi:hypothetical protein